MKNLYRINKTLIIINIVLGFTVYLGLVFLIPMGVTQIVMTILILKSKKKLTPKIIALLTLYCSITTVILFGTYLIYSGFIKSNIIFLIGMCISILLAFLHLYITYIYKIKTEY